MIDDPWFYAAAVPAILIAGISKGGFGGGLVVMAVPLLALVVDPGTAAAIMLPQLILMDLIGIRVYYRHWDRAQMKVLLPAAVLGILIGTLSFGTLDRAVVRLIIAAVAIGFCLHYWLGRAAAEVKRQVDVPRALFWGGLAGFTSFVAHAGGPPLSVYLLPRRLDKRIFVGTTVIFFTVANYLKLVPYYFLGQLRAESMTTSLVLAPLAFAGVGLGVFLHDRTNETWFYRICYVFLFLTGLKLLRDGILGLM